MLAAGARIRGYSSFEYIKDLGTPKRLWKVERDLARGVVARASLKIPQKAVFVDRDGTLNVHREFLNDPDQISLLPGVASGIRRLNDLEFRVVVVTNQPVVARGEASLAQLRRIHNKLETLLGDEGAYLDAIYVCPHHPDAGYAGEVPHLKIDCDCRKPKRGLIDRAAKDLHVELSRSWMIGDSGRDMLAAERAGLRSIQVLTGDAEVNKFSARPEFVCQDFASAIDIIADTTE
jgi:histidinol-phosphate phosphatase family protein